jgi:hypothetical protein
VSAGNFATSGIARPGTAVDSCEIEAIDAGMAGQAFSIFAKVLRTVLPALVIVFLLLLVSDLLLILDGSSVIWAGKRVSRVGS